MRVRPVAASGAALAVAAAVLVSGCGLLPGGNEPPARPVITQALPPSAPLRLDIPALDVHTRVTALGLNADSTVAVPPLRPNAPAGWYRYSPTPGQRGPAVILGHSTVGKAGDGVFRHLDALRRGDEIQVARRDGTLTTFTVERMETYPKAGFPTHEVYGDIAYPGLRLITCGGTPRPGSHEYPDNVVVYAALTGVGSARSS